ncbi:hypothetical protein Tco_0563629 [Tanacetum coccineum]
MDGGSSSEVMYEHCFRNLSPNTRLKLREFKVPLVQKNNDGVHHGKVSFPLQCHTGEDRDEKLGAVASTIHSMIKFPTAKEWPLSIEDLPTKRDAQVECLLKEDEPFIPSDHSTTPRREGKELMAKEETQKDVVQSKKVLINDDHPDQPITIDGNLLAECRKELTKTLCNHMDTFTWTLTDMTGIPRFIPEH